MSTKKSAKASKREKVEHGENTKYVDLLDEDKPVAGQKFVCISFISPEQILKKKELFFFEKYSSNNLGMSFGLF